VDYKFIDAVILGFADLSEIDDYIAKWHKNNNVSISLSSYLGMTDIEFSKWLIDNEYINEISKTIQKLFTESFEEQIMLMIQHKLNKSDKPNEGDK
jgi:hypothetical protein